jgi:hypothetical protein
MWVVLCKLFEIPSDEHWIPETRGKMNAAIAKFRAAGCKPDDLSSHFENYVERFGNPPASPLAMAVQVHLTRNAPPSRGRSNGRTALPIVAPRKPSRRSAFDQEEVHATDG